MDRTLTAPKSDVEKTGAVYWIDHFVTNSEDVPRWAAFTEKLLGAYKKPSPRGVFQGVGPCIVGAFEPKAPLPPRGELGRALPRYGFYIDKADIARHLARLDAYHVPHSEPTYVTSDGDAGTAIYWEDPDGNQFEFWAADRPPEGALESLSSERVGRLSHATFESRDLDRSARFFKTFCEIDRATDPGVAADTLVLRLLGGARIVYKKVDVLLGRTSGMGLSDAHTALTVPRRSLFPNYRRMWANLPEWGLDPLACKSDETMESLPARTARHVSPDGRRFYAAVEKGDDFYDWDTNLFHFVGGTPTNGSMAQYEPQTVGAYLAEWESQHGSLDGFRSMVIGSI